MAIIWPPDWTAMYALDGGGPRSRAAAYRYLLRLSRRGVQVAAVYAWRLDILAWAADLCRSEGFQVALVAQLGHNNGYAETLVMQGHADSKPTTLDVFHVGYSFDQASRTHAYCPNYDGPLWWAALGLLARQVQLIKPDVVVIDTEVWEPPDFVEQNLPGLIAACPRCGTVERYNAGWLAKANDIRAILDGCAPGIPVLYYGACRTPPPPIGKRYVHPGWPHTFDADPCLALYSCNKMPDPIATLAEALKVTPVKGGHPWLTPWVEWSKPERGFLPPAVLRKQAAMMRAEGAAGIQLWPGPRAEGDTEHDDALWAAVAAIGA